MVPVETSGLWPVFVAQAPHDAAVVLSPEHDASRWVVAGEALALVEPEVVTADLRVAISQCT